MSRGIIYEYEDGGRYCGEWENEHAHGYGVCTGPRGAGLFEGCWDRGHQTSGVYTWPSGQKYMGRWKQGLREGTGKETKPDGTEYSGDFTQDSRGPYGVLTLANGAVYSGHWSDGIQDGEGVETYSDGGVYRGQYKKGHRHGYGTRSSSAYELRGSAAPTSSPPSKLKQHQQSLVSSNFSASPILDQSQETPDSSAQLYEGEWREDKRHGHGVLKIPGYYTYYGGWESNTRCGHGVMMYANGRKDEGLWQNGRLVDVVKKKKLPVSLHKHSLESKVKHAHTQALQAADKARNKAMLAESRAQEAGKKARMALETAQRSLLDAKTAREGSEMYKNAPKVSEHVKSPMYEGFPDFPPLGNSNLKAGNSMDLLTVKKSIRPSTSCENIIDILQQATPRSESEDCLLSMANREAQMDSSADGRRSCFSQHSGSTDTTSFESHDSFEISDSSELKRKRERLLEMAQTSPEMFIRHRSDTSLSSSGSSSRQRRWSVEELKEEEGEEGGVIMIREGRVRPSLKRIHETGELDEGEVSDDDIPGDRPSKKLLAPPLPHPLEKKPSITADMLRQMANWNRMITYLNFALLLFLLVLILVFVVSMNYYYLVYHSPAPQNPASFMNPMA